MPDFLNAIGILLRCFAQFGELSPNSIHPTLDIRPHIAAWLDKLLGAAFFQPKNDLCVPSELDLFKSATAPSRCDGLRSMRVHSPQ